VFSKINSVTQLDLASLHDIHDDELVRQNPSRLFPTVNDLRLLGWMHRGLVKAIITSIDVRKLRRLTVDYLQDEGALPNGAPMSFDINEEYAHTLSKTESMEMIDQELYHRQETGKACIWPGPMWLPLRLLSAGPLNLLSHLEIKVVSLSWHVDLRNYLTVFHEAVKLMLKLKGSLETLIICMGERPCLYEEFLNAPNQCGSWRNRMRSWYRPWCIKMAASFLDQSLAVLNRSTFPKLKTIRFEGFDILKTANPVEVEFAGLADTYQGIRDCPFANATFTETRNLDDRDVFQGFDCIRYANMGGFHTALLVNS
jgi:hypothetical protein